MQNDEASVVVAQVRREDVYGLWPLLYAGVVTYNTKSPHLTAAPEAVLANLLSADGDELLLIVKDTRYAGFLTYKEIDLEGERCAAVAMIYADEEDESVLPAAMPKIKDYFASLGCSRISFFTARHGFRKLGPRLGFKPRIVEWTMEVG